MKENKLHYNYATTVYERYDLTRNEAISIIKSEEKRSKENNRAVILTGKDKEKQSFFDAYTQGEISHNFTWIHFCPQEILEFDEEDQKGKYYVMIMTALKQ